MSTEWKRFQDALDDKYALVISSGLKIEVEGPDSLCKFFLQPEDVEDLMEALQLAKWHESQIPK